jgi:hypothetical protein
MQLKSDKEGLRVPHEGLTRWELCADLWGACLHRRRGGAVILGLDSRGRQRPAEVAAAAEVGDLRKLLAVPGS